MESITSITLLWSEILNIQKKANAILECAFINKGKSSTGWRNGFDSVKEPGATATALGLWYCRKAGRDIQMDDGKGGKNNIAAFYPSMIETVLSMQKECKETGEKTGWPHTSDEEKVPCVDSTTTVIMSLGHWGLTHKNPEIINAITPAVKWLLKKNKSSGEHHRGWGINDLDSDRVFVTCNVLQAILKLSGVEYDDNERDVIQHAINWIIECKKEEEMGWSWGETKSPSKSSLFHTAKVVNFLQTYMNETNTYTKNVKRAYDEGMNYIHLVIKKGILDFTCTEKCYYTLRGSNHDKKYYHDGFAELVNLMLNTRNDWTMYEVCVIVKKYINEFQSLEPWIQEEKIQMFLLLPTIKQINDLLKTYLPSFGDKLIVSSAGIILIDPEKRIEKWYVRCEKPLKKKLAKILLILLLIGISITAIFKLSSEAISMIIGVSGILCCILSVGFSTEIKEVHDRIREWMKKKSNKISNKKNKE